jgi:hypothetical protein
VFATALIFSRYAQPSTGHDVFPYVGDQGDGSDEQVQRRFLAHQFPQDSHACSTITALCWQQAYSSAIEVTQDIETIEKNANTERDGSIKDKAYSRLRGGSHQPCNIRRDGPGLHREVGYLGKEDQTLALRGVWFVMIRLGNALRYIDTIEVSDSVGRFSFTSCR